MRNIPTITKNLLIINILAFLAMWVLSKANIIDLNNLFGLHFLFASKFHVWQFVTYMFMHANFEHIFFNMFALWMFGCVVERVWGGKKFLFYYIICGIGAGLLQEIAQFFWLYFDFNSQSPLSISQAVEVMKSYSTNLNGLTTVGASGAIYGILLAFGMTFPEERIFIFPLPVPIKAKWFIMIYIAIELFSALATPGDNVAHIAHLGGMLFGYLLIKYWNKHPEHDLGVNGLQNDDFFGKMRAKMEQRNQRKSQQTQSQSYTKQESDWDYNQRKAKEQEEIDRILDKIRKSGYDSLTKEEKQKLFDQSKN